MATWKILIDCALDKGEKLVHCTLTDKEMHKEFDCGFGGAEGKSFTAWSKDYVYFPLEYDGAESVGRAPRNPCDVATGHQG